MKDSKVYVISVEYKADYEEEYGWRYAAMDLCAGSFSTGYPTWGNYDANARTFATIEEAEKWWNSNKEFLRRSILNSNADIIPDTLGIREKTYVFSKNLEF